VTLAVSIQPTNHLRFDFNGDRRWVNVAAGDHSGRLFTAQVERLKATYNLNASTYFRLILEYVETRRDLSLYTEASPPAREGGFSLSALYAYKLNWQSVIFIGYDNNSVLDESGRLLTSGRQFFLKISHAFQR
jgi:hypothetical protein